MGFFYLGQGYALSSLVVLLPIYIFRELGSSRSTAVIISAIIIFPWYLKFLFGILSDYFPISTYGRRKPYLVVATLFSFLGWTTLGFHDDLSFAFVLSGISLALGSALGDAVIDGQAVEITPEEYIGRLQGIAWASRGLGIGAAGIVSAQLVEQYGWQMMFHVTAIFGISITIIVLILPQATISAELQSKSRIPLISSSLRDIITQNRSWYRFTFFLFTGIAISIVPLLSLIMEREFNYSVGQIGFGALFFALGSFIGAVSQGIISDQKDNMNRFVLLSLCFVVVILLGLFFISSENRNQQSLYLGLVGAVAGAYEAYQLRVVQEESTKNFEGTTFALWTGVSNIGQFLFGGVVIIQIAEYFNISILLAMQLLVPVLFLVLFSIKNLKFRETT